MLDKGHSEGKRSGSVEFYSYLAGALDYGGDIRIDTSGRISIELASNEAADLEQIRDALGVGSIQRVPTRATPYRSRLVVADPDYSTDVIAKVIPYLRRLRRTARSALEGTLQATNECVRPDCARAVRGRGLCAAHLRQLSRGLRSMEVTDPDERKLVDELFRQGKTLDKAVEMVRLTFGSDSVTG